MDIPKSLKGVPLAYEYKSVELDKTERMAGASCKIGKPVTFREDGDTLLVEQDGTLLGQMKPTRIADMIRDWERRKDPYLAELSAFPLGGGAAKLTLAFYREESAWWRDRREKIVARIGRPEPTRLPTYCTNSPSLRKKRRGRSPLSYSSSDRRQNRFLMHSLTLTPSSAAALRMRSATSAGRLMCKWVRSPSEMAPNSTS